MNRASCWMFGAILAMGADHILYGGSKVFGICLICIGLCGTVVAICSDLKGMPL